MEPYKQLYYNILIYRTPLKIATNSPNQSRSAEILFTNTEYSLSEKIIINQKAASYVTVHVVQKGGLSDVLVDKELNPESIISMKIIGELDAEDFLTIQNMINLKNLDLEEVNLTELPTKAFYKEEFYKLKYCSTVVYMVPRA